MLPLNDARNVGVMLFSEHRAKYRALAEPKDAVPFPLTSRLNASLRYR